MLLATLSIGILYIFTTYAIDVAFGPDKFAGFGSSGPDSWEGIARSLYGGFWVLIFLAIVNSTIANANAGVNVSSRTAFAMGRVGAFPYALARLSTRHRSPVRGDPAGHRGHHRRRRWASASATTRRTAFFMVATVLVILLVAIYILVEHRLHRLLPARRPQRVQPAAAPGHPDSRASSPSSRPG